jgi:hypothetical protein
MSDKPLSRLDRLEAIERLAADFKLYPNHPCTIERLFYLIECLIAILKEQGDG